MKYDSFDNKYFPKKDGISQVMFNRDLLSSIIQAISNRIPLQGDFWVAATLFKNATVKFQTDAGFLLVRKVFTFNFVLGGYGFNPLNNFKYLYYDYLSVAAKDYKIRNARL
jgi:NTE family protein